MTTFSKDELLHLAALSGLPLEEREIALFGEQIKAILTYVDQIQSAQLPPAIAEQLTQNVLREDRAERKPSEALLAQAPATDDGYFVVQIVTSMIWADIFRN